MINSFDGHYRFLSNFYLTTIKYQGVEYISTEHAYQAAKATNASDKLYVATAPTCGQAKRRGQEIPMREDWDFIKDQVMYDVCKLKFEKTAMKELLLSTGDMSLVEGNTWGDTYWGVCKGVGLNKLGKTLMRIRSELK